MPYVTGMREPQVVAWTDGACSGNPGPGGWAYLATFPSYDQTVQNSGYEFWTTNNKMELAAVIKLLELFSDGQQMKILIHSDSQYLINSFEKGWINGWQRYNWVKRDGNEVANKELWQLMLEVMKPHYVTFKWVKGHHLDVNNHLVDQLAVDACRYAVRHRTQKQK